MKMKMNNLFFFFFVLFFVYSFAYRVPKGIHVTENTILGSSTWLLQGRAPNDLEVSFSIAMRQRNLEKLKEILYDVSTPSSPLYGQFLSRDEVEAFVRTSDEDIHSIYEWLEEYNIDTSTCNVINGDILRCSAFIENIENLLSCELYQLVKKTNNDIISITQLGVLTIPRELDDVIDLIQGLSYIPFRKAIFHDGSDPFANEISNSFEEFISKSSLVQLPIESNSPSTIDPIEPIRTETATTCPASASKGCSTSNGVSTDFCCDVNSVCCPGFGGASCCVGGYTCCYGQCRAATDCTPTEDIYVQPEVLRHYYSIPSNLRAVNNYFNQSVVAFFDEYSQGALEYFQDTLNEKQVTVHRQGPTGCLPNCDQVESDLDMQYMSSMGNGIGLWFWYNQQGYTLEWAQDVLSTPNSPIVFSISYISGEYQLGTDYIQRSNAEFIKMGTLGITVAACSGDTGAPGWSINFPVDNLARNFPFDCPNCPLGVNLCNQITVKTANNVTCNVPSGMYSRDFERGLPCDAIMVDTDCQNALSDFIQSANSQFCNFSIVDDSENIPRVFTMNCTCANLPSVTHGSCTISGYNFDINNGSPLTSLYPASSPFATAVGATQFSELTNYLCNQDVMGETIHCDIGEVASSIATGSAITSGGGFSTIAMSEPYQSSAVLSYLNSGVPFPTGYFNSSNRAYPDVSFGGHNWIISYSKDTSENCPCGFGMVDGTSCASPGFAGLVSLLNQELFVANRPPLGFLNPLLYEMAAVAPQTFNDITVGDNYCTETLCSEQIGYKTTFGYDTVTGLGTPNFTNMLEYILN